MSLWVKRRSVVTAALLLGGVIPSVWATGALAAGPPQVVSARVETVTATSAVLRGQVNPNGTSTTFRFEYLTEAAYQANLASEPAGDGFQGAQRSPANGAGPVGAGSAPVPVVPQQLSSLSPLTSFRYRLVATNSFGTDPGGVHSFTTQAGSNVFQLLDRRGWEMVSPVDKGGGSIAPPETLFGGGAFQAAADGGSVTYSSAFSFAGGQGAPAVSQYLAGRTASVWSTANITTPILSGSYGDEPDGAPYRLFSSDLSRGLLSNGERCRGEAGGPCPVANPPLPGSGAPAGFRDYYLRGAGPSFKSILTGGALNNTPRTASEFELDLAGATPDLAHVVLSTCAALSADATELGAGGACATAPQNLYKWSGSALTALNLLPGDSTTTPGATLAASSGAISADGSRVYWSAAGALYLRDGGATKLVAPAGVFQTASSDGALAFFTAGGHLYRYEVPPGISTDLTPAGGVVGVLGAAADGSAVYYATAAGLFLWQEGTTTRIADAPLTSSYPPATGTARVSADGSHVLFLSSVEQLGYPNDGNAEAYLYGPPPGGSSPRLACVSCKPTGETADGPASLPGAVANGSTAIYRPRTLSADGGRVFFNSGDRLSIQDTNGRPDVYEWEAAGKGSCTVAPGCVQLISGGRGPDGSTFLDAAADGSSAFLLTDESLVATDPGSTDVYVAREDGGFPVPRGPFICVGDSCQPLPSPPDDPAIGTLVPNSGNPVVATPKPKPKKPRHKKKHSRKKHHAKRGGKR